MTKQNSLNNETVSQSANNNSTKMASTAYADAKVADAIADGVTTVAPSQNATFDALALKAPIASPTFTGNPTAPTPTAGDNDTSIATTAFTTLAVQTAITASGSLVYSNTSVPAGNTIANTASETAFAQPVYSIPANSLIAGSVIRLKLWGVYSTDAILAPTITAKVKIGGVTYLTTGAVTAIVGVTNGGWFADCVLTIFTAGASGTLDAQAYVEFATAATTGLSVNVKNTATQAIDTTAANAVTVTVQWSAADTDNTITLRSTAVYIENLSNAATAGTFVPINNGAMTGVPTAPTAAQDTNTTQLATTAFVVAQAGAATPIVDGTGAAGTSLRYSRQDHVHPTDTSRAALASPTFTGTPSAPTATPGTNTTQLATTAFVVAADALDLKIANNLSDVASVPTALANLGQVYYDVTSDVVNLTTTLATITGLSFAVAANSTYFIDATLRLGCSGTGGAMIGADFPTGATLGTSIVGRTNAAANQGGVARVDTTPAAINLALSTNGDAAAFVLVNMKLVTAATAGTFTMQFKSVTVAQTSTVYADTSRMIVHKKV